MLYSVSLQILERLNVSLLGKPTILSIVNIDNWVIPLLIIAILLIISLLALLNSNFGPDLRAFGQNQKLLSIYY